MEIFDNKLDRRNFLKKTASVSAAALLTPTILSLLADSGCSPTLKNGMDENQIKTILDKALARGGNFAEIYTEEVTSLSFAMREHSFTDATLGISSGIGVRTVDGDRNGYAYIYGSDESKILEAAATAAYIAAGHNTPKFGAPINSKSPAYCPVKIPINNIPEKRKMELVAEAEAAVRDFSPYIRQVDITYYDETKKRSIANSNGLRIENELPLIWVVVEVLAERDGIRHKGRSRISAHQGFEFFDNNVLVKAAMEAAQEAVTMLDAKPAPSGMMPVVVNRGWGGVLIHEAVGHGLEGDVIYRGTSIYSDKLGKRVGSNLVTLVDDSTWKNARGTTEFDDEGTFGKRNVLIENGILQQFMLDLISARMLKMETTGNGRRQSFSHYPIPRMTNTYLDNGNSKHDDIIASTKKGLYVKGLSGGEVDTISGQFNFIVREAYLIENGKVTTPVAGATLIGRGIDVLTNIDAVADDLDIGPGWCGKDDQWAPVTAGMPTVRVNRGITVGGSE
jgi:TldD protein